ncbi:acyl carrier protein [Roseicitreum antarcticum]|uniref:Acyl carrier protein n=1 Tax=Roseicitreum antarcticum TaxID=564137 RepID=A0A1H2TXH6_9RHOB|nr:acyl carrier protein [Roseicitreum antarcticum]SDW47999.1 acyl carrier protein [Roseicitreum antarcticum]
MTYALTDEVVGIVAEQALCDPRDVSLDATLSELGIDSLGLVECIFAIEERFDVTVPFNANTPGDTGFDTRTVRALVEGVESLVALQAA